MFQTAADSQVADLFMWTIRLSSPFSFSKNIETLISCEPSGLSNTALITVCFWGSDCPHGCKGGRMFDQSSEVVLTCVTLLCCSSFDPSTILCFFLPVTLCCSPTTKQNLPWSAKACFSCHYALNLVITLLIPQPSVPQCPSYCCFRLLSSVQGLTLTLANLPNAGVFQSCNSHSCTSHFGGIHFKCNPF